DIEMKNITLEAINVNTFYTGPEAMGPSPAVSNIFICDVTVDKVPTGLSFIGFPGKWLENTNLENITKHNADVCDRINRVKDLNLKNVSISSKSGALSLNQVYEARLEGVTLSDQTEANPLTVTGADSGAIFVEDNLKNRINFGSDLTEKIINPEDKQAW